MFKRGIAIAAVAAVILAVLLWSQKRSEPLKVSGFVESDEIRLGSRVGGRIVKVNVTEGQAVKAGQVLVELEPFDLVHTWAQAQAQLAQHKADYEKLSAGYRAEDILQAKARRDELAARLQELINGPRKETIDAARGRLEQAQAIAQYAKTRLENVRASAARGAATSEEIDQATQAMESTAAALAVRQAELAELLAGTRPEEIAMAKAQLEQAEQAFKEATAGFRKEEIEAAKAAMAAAEAAMLVIDSQIAELQIKAPVDGVIEASDLQPGQLISPNAPAMTMLAAGNLYVRSYIPENRLSVQTGSKVQISTDSFPGKKFEGKVIFVAREGEFTPSNLQTTEKRVEQVFRIKVAIESGTDVLRPGMPVDVWLGGTASK